MFFLNILVLRVLFSLITVISGMHLDLFVSITVMRDLFLYSLHCFSGIDEGHSLEPLYLLIGNTFKSNNPLNRIIEPIRPFQNHTGVNKFNKKFVFMERLSLIENKEIWGGFTYNAPTFMMCTKIHYERLDDTDTWAFIKIEDEMYQKLIELALEKCQMNWSTPSNFMYRVFLILAPDCDSTSNH